MFEGLPLAAIGGLASAIFFVIVIELWRWLRKGHAYWDKERDKAVSEGKRAFFNGIGEKENPYDASQPKLRDAWKKGWLQGKKTRSKLD